MTKTKKLNTLLAGLCFGLAALNLGLFIRNPNWFGLVAGLVCAASGSFILYMRGKFADGET